MQYVAEPLIQSEETERLLSKLPRVIILNSQTGLEAVLANLLVEASMLDVTAMSLHAPLEDAVRGLLFGGDPGANLEDVPNGKEIEASIHSAIERALGEHAVINLAIERIDSAENDYPTTVVYDVYNDEQAALLYKKFGADCLFMHLHTADQVPVPPALAVHDGITSNQLIEGFIAALPKKE